jgi:hypothetical protein
MPSNSTSPLNTVKSGKGPSSPPELAPLMPVLPKPPISLVPAAVPLVFQMP